MLDSNGFSRPTRDDLTLDLTAKWLELFGSDANTSSHSIGGIFIRLIAYFLDVIYQLTENVYYSQFVSTATGVSLDRVADNYGITRNAPAQAITDLTITGTPGYLIQEGTLFKTESGLQYQTGDDLILSASGSGTVIAYATAYGEEYNTPANTIKLQSEPVSDIFTVTNELPVTSGADIESDEELSNRIRLANDTHPSSPVNGIISSVLTVAGTRTVRVLQNNTMSVDTYGNPAKSIHVYVDGGERTQIANALFNSVSAGVLTVGNEQVNVTDDAGFSDNVVAFDFAQQQTIYASIVLFTNINFESDGVQQVKDAVNSYLDEVPMGSPVRFSYLYKYIYDNVAGLDVIEVKIGTQADSLSMTDVSLSEFAIPVTTDDSIEVTVNA